MPPKSSLFLYIVKFFFFYFVLYYGTKAVIGLSVHHGYYVPWIHDYFNYPAALRKSILKGSQLLLSLFGYNTYIPDDYHLRLVGGRGIHMVYSCLGIGLLSFWIAFIAANNGGTYKKITWILTGCLLIWFVNCGRVALLVVATNKNKPLPFNLDNHTLFNIAAYLVIFIMIYFFDLSQRKNSSKKPS